MKAIDLIIKTEIARKQQNLVFELLGKYGDKLPKEIQADMRTYANDIETDINNLKKRMANEI